MPNKDLNLKWIEEASVIFGNYKLTPSDFSLDGFHASLSSNGKYLSFCNWKNGIPELKILNLNSGEVTPVGEADKTVPRWDYKSKNLVFGKNNPVSDIFKYNIENKEITRVTYFKDSWGPSIEYQTLVFSRKERPNTELWKKEGFESPSQIGFGSHPAIKEGKVLYVGLSGEKRTIKLLNLKTKHIDYLCEGVLPSWGLTTEEIFFNSEGGIPNNRVYYMNLKEMVPKKIIDLPFRHPEIESIGGINYLIMENTPSENSKIKIFKLGDLNRPL